MRAEWWPGHPASLHHPVSGQELLRPRTPSGSWAGAHGASGHAQAPHGRDTCRDTPAAAQTHQKGPPPPKHMEGSQPGQPGDLGICPLPGSPEMDPDLPWGLGPVGTGGPAYFLTLQLSFSRVVELTHRSGKGQVSTQPGNSAPSGTQCPGLRSVQPHPAGEWDGPAQGSQIPGADSAIPREGSKGRGQAPHDLGKERPLLMRAARPLGWP